MEIAVDTNFDGRADVEEYYEHGALVRRESDRDFNDRIDLVQDFDPATNEPIRSVVDVDADGIADLLILFRDGQPVFSKWTHPVKRVVSVGRAVFQAKRTHRTANDRLAPLQDPFRTDFSVSAVHVLSGGSDSVGLSTSGGLPAFRYDITSSLACSSALAGRVASRQVSVVVTPHSPRGPPSLHLLLS